MHDYIAQDLRDVEDAERRAYEARRELRRRAREARNAAHVSERRDYVAYEVAVSVFGIAAMLILSLL